MTILKCSAMTCVYNKEQLCSKGDIDVTGENATSANETSCGSFRERTGSSMKDSYTDGCGCDKIQIDCKAHNCTYNDSCKCTASSIQVDGSNAHMPLPIQDVTPSSAIVAHNINTMATGFSPVYQG